MLSKKEVFQFEAASARNRDFALAHQREFEKKLAIQEEVDLKLALDRRESGRHVCACYVLR